MTIVTRFAPSPTGFLHIGGARTALFNYLFSKNRGGKFLLRIEDTDQKRSTSEAVDAIISGLEWLGIKNDDQIVFQSKNIEQHKEAALKLLEMNKAYYCYTSAEELTSLRIDAEKKGQIFRFKSPWRDNPPSSASNLPKPVIRLKSPLEGETVIHDLVQGEIKVANSELDDLVVLRSDGTPTYNLAVVVDDHNMKISHIIRGDDHLGNAFRQKIIYEAMSWNVPEFAHIPLIYGSDGTKMSKRHGATSVIEYKEMGYLPEALRNYLLRLGWSHGNEEIISDENAIKWFNIEKVGKSPARFDFAKLNNLNKHYIKELSEEKLFDLIADKLDKNLSKNSREKIIRALKFIKERAVLIPDLIHAVKIYQDGFKTEISSTDLEIIKNNSSLISEIKEIISKIIDWNHDGIKAAINDYSAAKNLKFKDFGPALRIALTFSSATAGGVFDVIEILGKEEVLKRLELL